MTQLDDSPLLGDAYTNDRRRVFHSWSAQGALDPVVLAGALGSKMWDADGTTWIDFTSQLVNMNLGHQHPRMIEAIKQQAERLCMVAPNFANDQRSEAARLIVEKANLGKDVSRYSAALEAYAKSLPQTYGQDNVPFLYAQPAAALVEGIGTPQIDGAHSIEFDQWPKSLEAIATQLGTLAAETLSVSTSATSAGGIPRFGH